MDYFSEQLCDGFGWRFDAELLHRSKSEYQTIEVFDHPYFGRTLVLDGCVQTTERDEFHYHELLVHPVMCSKQDPSDVLIIGGGDGGVLRRVLEHPVQSAVMCELDEEVTEVSKRLMPTIAKDAFDDPRANVVFEDGYEYVKQCKGRFDAILVDSTDLVGPAAVLGSIDFYSACQRALKQDGQLVAQSGSVHFQADSLVSCHANLSHVFQSAEIYAGIVPTYPGVLWSFMVAPRGIGATPPELIDSRLIEREITTRYYTGDVHRALFSLPKFVSELIATPK